MESRSPSLREKVRQLRGTFLCKLPETLGAARRTCVRLTATPTDAGVQSELSRVFHSIKGTALSLGLSDVGAESAVGEQLMEAYHAQHLLPDAASAGDLLEPVRACIDRLEALGQQAAEAGDASSSAFAAPAAAPVLQMPDCDRQAGGKRVFVCDDEELQTEILQAQLSCFGYAVTPFATPESLREAVLESPPDAVVLDIMFPDGVIGTEVAASLQREMAVPPPIVFISSRRDFDARLRSVKAGGQAYFAKPLKAIDLVETLDILTGEQEPDPYRVLIVDDEPEVAAYHAFILDQVGMTTQTLGNPDMILSVLSDFTPDLVLMDMYMPACSGRELSQVIRQMPEYISLPIIFLSSETDKVKQVSALRVGAEGFLTKPIQPDDLISAVAIRAERMRTLRSLMVRDSLTGLFNHTFMLQFLESVAAGAQRDGSDLSFVMLDIDHFKVVNDTQGHPAGDQVLVALSRLLQQRLRTSDMVGRYGGEEFAIILRDTDIEKAFQVVDELRSDFGRINFQGPEGEFSCTFSAGLASFSGSGPAEHLLEQADQALYRAKRAGRNRTVVAQ